MAALGLGFLWTLVGVVPAVASESREAPASTARVEGAIGLVARGSRSEFGSGGLATRFVPAGFIRWRSLTLTGSGGFTTRSRDAVEGGIASDLTRSDRFRIRWGLSLDRGRGAFDVPALGGASDIPPTVRGRVTASTRIDPRWGLSMQWNADLLDRGGGHVVQAAVDRRWDLDPQRSVSAGVTAQWADTRHASQRYGVDATQSAVSGLATYRAGSGWMRAQLNLTWRAEFRYLDEPWAAFVGLSQGWLLGDAARSPLVTRPHDWGWSGGLVWRF